MTEPVKMENGNWVMPGFIVGRGNPPAVAVSDGDNLMSWNLKVIPVASHVLIIVRIVGLGFKPVGEYLAVWWPCSGSI